jgi:CysZ protein
MGLFAGVGAFIAGVSFIARTPRLWWRAMVPAVTALVLAVGFGFGGIHFALAWAHRVLGEGVGEKLLAVAVVSVVVLLAMVLAISLAQPLSGWALDGIVRAQARALGEESLEDPPRFAGMLRSAASSLAALAVGIPTIVGLAVVGWLVPPAAIVTVPLKIVVTALLLAWDLLDYPLAFHGMSMGARVGWCLRHMGAVLGFGLAATVFFAVPGIGLLALPCGVAGATRLVYSAGRDGRNRHAPRSILT